MSLRGVSDLEDFRATMLARQAEAEAAFVERGDAGPRMELWSRRDPVTLYGALGISESGWEQLSQIFRWVASRFSGCTAYNFELVAAGVSGDLAYTVGFERSAVSIDGGPAAPRVLRVTHVYRREDGEWKIVHRHGDNPGNDPRSKEDADD